MRHSARRPRLVPRALIVALALAPSLAVGAAACGASDDGGAASTFGDAGAAPADPGRDGSSGLPSDAAPDGATSGRCDTYCALVAASCEGSHAQFASPLECRAACAALPAGTTGDRSENSVGCRVHFAETAAPTDPAAYCPVAGPTGGGICGTRCEAFCALAVGLCAAHGAPWGSAAACMADCAAFPYEGDGAAGDTLDCRLVALREAIRDRAGHCADLGVDSGVCR